MPVSSCIKLAKSEQEELRGLVSQVLQHGVKQGTFVLPSAPKAKALFEVAACFVTLYSAGELRGCVGTYTAEKPLWHGACRYSYCSAFEDERFSPLEQSELATLTFEISVLSELVSIGNKGEAALIAELRPNVDGLILQDKNHSAVFLPTVWQSLKTPQEFVSALKSKGRWPASYWSDEIEIFRFDVVVY